MASDENDERSVSVSVPIGAAVAGVLLLGSAAAIYFLLGGGSKSSTSGESSVANSSRSFLRKMGILGLATMIENDFSRKFLVSILKAIARRA